jgi:hypothetical protein
MCIRCRGDDFTELLPSSDRGATHTDTDSWEGFMKYAAEIGSGVMIHIPIFILVKVFKS